MKDTRFILWMVHYIHVPTLNVNCKPLMQLEENILICLITGITFFLSLCGMHVSVLKIYNLLTIYMFNKQFVFLVTEYYLVYKGTSM